MLVSLSMGDVGSSGIGVLQLKAEWRVATRRGNGCWGEIGGFILIQNNVVLMGK